jgi:catechol 2,3-dioxygenase-like lactoylglutathione lyase family enzyme
MQITDGGTLHHVGIAVHDVEKSAAALAKSGLGPWGVWTIEPETTTVRGKDVPFSFRIAFVAVGGSNFELIAPLEGESIYVDFLKTNGEGMHHTCVAYSTREALRAAKAELSSQGRELVQNADMGDLGEFCYFQMPELGSLLELLYVSEMPPPQSTIA